MASPSSSILPASAPTSSTTARPPLPPASRSRARACPSPQARLWDRLLCSAESRNAPPPPPPPPTSKHSSSSRRRASSSNAKSSVTTPSASISTKRGYFTFAPRDIGDSHLRQSFEQALLYDGLLVSTDFRLSIDIPNSIKSKKASSVSASSRAKRARPTSSNSQHTQHQHHQNEQNILSSTRQHYHRRVRYDDELDDINAKDDFPIVVNNTPQINIIPVSKLPPSDFSVNQMKKLARATQEELDEQEMDIQKSKSGATLSVRDLLRADQEAEPKSPSNKKRTNGSSSRYPHQSSFSGSYRVSGSPSEKRRLSKTANNKSSNRQRQSSTVSALRRTPTQSELLLDSNTEERNAKRKERRVSGDGDALRRRRRRARNADDDNFITVAQQARPNRNGGKRRRRHIVESGDEYDDELINDVSSGGEINRNGRNDMAIDLIDDDDDDEVIHVGDIKIVDKTKENYKKSNVKDSSFGYVEETVMDEGAIDLPPCPRPDASVADNGGGFLPAEDVLWITKPPQNGKKEKENRKKKNRKKATIINDDDYEGGDVENGKERAGQDVATADDDNETIFEDSGKRRVSGAECNLYSNGRAIGKEWSVPLNEKNRKEKYIVDEVIDGGGPGYDGPSSRIHDPIYVDNSEQGRRLSKSGLCPKSITIFNDVRSHSKDAKRTYSSKKGKKRRRERASQNEDEDGPTERQKRKLNTSSSKKRNASYDHVDIDDNEMTLNLTGVNQYSSKHKSSKEKIDKDGYSTDDMPICQLSASRDGAKRPRNGKKTKNVSTNDWARSRGILKNGHISDDLRHQHDKNLHAKNDRSKHSFEDVRISVIPEAYELSDDDDDDDDLPLSKFKPTPPIIILNDKDTGNDESEKDKIVRTDNSNNSKCDVIMDIVADVDDDDDDVPLASLLQVTSAKSSVFTKQDKCVDPTAKRATSGIDIVEPIPDNSTPVKIRKNNDAEKNPSAIAVDTPVPLQPHQSTVAIKSTYTDTIPTTATFRKDPIPTDVTVSAVPQAAFSLDTDEAKENKACKASSETSMTLRKVCADANVLNTNPNNSHTKAKSATTCDFSKPNVSSTKSSATLPKDPVEIAFQDPVIKFRDHSKFDGKESSSSVNADTASSPTTVSKCERGNTSTTVHTKTSTKTSAIEQITKDASTKDTSESMELAPKDPAPRKLLPKEPVPKDPKSVQTKSSDETVVEDIDITTNSINPRPLSDDSCPSNADCTRGLCRQLELRSRKNGTKSIQIPRPRIYPILSPNSGIASVNRSKRTTPTSTQQPHMVTLPPQSQPIPAETSNNHLVQQRTYMKPIPILPRPQVPSLDIDISPTPTIVSNVPSIVIPSVPGICSSVPIVVPPPAPSFVPLLTTTPKTAIVSNDTVDAVKTSVISDVATKPSVDVTNSNLNENPMRPAVPTFLTESAPSTRSDDVNDADSCANRSDKKDSYETTEARKILTSDPHLKVLGDVQRTNSIQIISSKVECITSAIGTSKSSGKNVVNNDLEKMSSMTSGRRAGPKSIWECTQSVVEIDDDRFDTGSSVMDNGMKKRKRRERTSLAPSCMVTAPLLKKMRSANILSTRKADINDWDDGSDDWQVFVKVPLRKPLNHVEIKSNLSQPVLEQREVKDTGQSDISVGKDIDVTTSETTEIEMKTYYNVGSGSRGRGRGRRRGRGHGTARLSRSHRNRFATENHRSPMEIGDDDNDEVLINAAPTSESQNLKLSDDGKHSDASGGGNSDLAQPESTRQEGTDAMNDGENSSAGVGSSLSDSLETDVTKSPSDTKSLNSCEKGKDGCDQLVSSCSNSLDGLPSLKDDNLKSNAKLVENRKCENYNVPDKLSPSNAVSTDITDDKLLKTIPSGANTEKAHSPKVASSNNDPKDKRQGQKNAEIETRRIEQENKSVLIRLQIRRGKSTT